MATGCQRCNQPVEASEYEVTKGAAKVRRIFCDPCAERTAEVYPVKPIGRQPAKAQPKDEKPQAAATSTSAQKEEE